MNFINDAFAMAGQSQGAQGGSPFSMIMFLVIIFGIFYFLMIRPQRKRQAEHQKFIGNLQKGDEVITDSGVIGKITGIAEKVITLEVADNVKIKLLKGRVMGLKKHLDEPATTK